LITIARRLPTSRKTSRSAHGSFKATRWSIVSAASPKQADSTRRRTAMEQLARDYWPPLYAFLRRRGNSPEAAEDLTQEFFARLIEKKVLGGVQRAKGRFRAFLLAALKNFELNQIDKRQAEKRGGGVKTISLDIAEAESRYGRMSPERSTPEAIFNRRWALAVLERVVFALQRDYVEKGQGKLFDALKPALTMDTPGAYGMIAVRLGMNEPAVRVAAHRLRQRYRRMLRDQIAQTVADESMVEDEIRELFSCL
jgi:RNA polymerase sigma factor (sigma-70 family)